MIPGSSFPEIEGETFGTAIACELRITRTSKLVFDISWYGILWSGALTAIAACSAVVFLVIQYWSGGIRDRQADWRASTLEAQTATAKADVAKANADIVKANAQIAEANKQAAALQKDAEQARFEQEQLKQIVAWRTLSDDSANIILNVLKQKKAVITLSYVAGDPEALALAIQFSKILEKANWQAAPNAMTFASALVFAIRVPGPENETVDLLRKALPDAHVPFSTEEIPAASMGFISSAPDTPTATLFIGSKRPPF
jgi:hypothetical protein